MDITLQEIADIIDDSKGNNYFAQQLESSLMPMFKKLKSLENSKEEVSLMNLFSFDGEKSKKYKDQYEKALKAFIKGFEEKVGEFKSVGIMELVAGKPNNNSVNTNTTTPNTPIPTALGSGGNQNVNAMLSSIVNRKRFDTEESQENILMVNIVDIEEKILKKLGVVKPPLGGGEGGSGGGGLGSSDKSGSILGKILKAVTLGGIAAGLLTGGIAIALKGLMEGGPTKGLFKIIAKLFVSFGNRIYKGFLNTVDGFFKPFAKILDLKIVKGVFKWGSSKFIFQSIGKIFKPLMTIGRGMGKGMKLVFKAIPYLGSIISLAFAVSRFKEGDTVGGLLELTSALLGLIPIPALALIPDVILMFRDFTMTSRQKVNQGGSFLIGLRNWFVELPVIKHFISLFTGLKMLFFGGDIDEAIMHLEDASGLLWLIPPLIPMIEVMKVIQDPSKFLKAARSVVDSTVSGLGWIWENLGAIFKKIWSWWEGLVVRIWESNYVKSLRLKTNIFFLKLRWGIDKLIDGINKLLIWAADKAMGTAEWITDVVGADETSKMIKQARQGLTFTSRAAETEKAISDRQKELLQIQKNINDKRSMHEQKKQDEREKRNKQYQDARHREMLDKMDLNSAAQVAATQNAGNQITASLVNRGEGGNSVTNIFTGRLSEQSDEVRKRAFQAMFGGYTTVSP